MAMTISPESPGSILLMKLMRARFSELTIGTAVGMVRFSRDRDRTITMMTEKMDENPTEQEFWDFIQDNFPVESLDLPE